MIFFEKEEPNGVVIKCEELEGPIFKASASKEGFTVSKEYSPNYCPEYGELEIYECIELADSLSILLQEMVSSNLKK